MSLPSDAIRASVGKSKPSAPSDATTEEAGGVDQGALIKKEIAVQKAGFASEFLQLQQANEKLQWQVHNSKVHNAIVIAFIVFLLVTLIYDYVTIDARFHTMINAIDAVRSPNGDYQGPSGTAIAYAYTYPWYNNDFLQDSGNRSWPFAVVYTFSTPAFANILLSDSSGKALEAMYRYANANTNDSAEEIVCKSGPFSNIPSCEQLCKPTNQGGVLGWINGALGGTSQIGMVAAPFFMAPTPGLKVVGGVILGIGLVYGLVSHGIKQNDCEKTEKHCRKTDASKC